MRRWPLAGGAHILAVACVGLGVLGFLQAIRVGGWEALGWGAGALVLLGASVVLAPVALALAATGWGALRRRALVVDAMLCALGILVALALAFAVDLSWGVRAAGVFAGALDVWGVTLAVRLWRHSASLAATRPST